MEVPILLAILAVALVLFVTQLVRTEVTALGIIVALALFGILTPEEALSGFSSPATLTVAAMLVLSVGLERTGVVEFGARLLSRGKASGWRGLMLLLALPTVLFSAFMNNTPVVALMIPVALALARRRELAPSRVLLPISYFSILGGTCTLLGTSTNILVDALYRKEGGPGFGIFDFAPMGLCFLAVGGTYVLLVGPKLLPDRAALSELLAVQAPGRFVTEVVLRAGSRYVGKELEKAFPADRDVTVLEVVRDEQPIIGPARTMVLEENDVLYVESTASTLGHLFADPDIERGTAVADDDRVVLHALLAGDLDGNQNEVLEALEAGNETEKTTRVELHMAEAVLTPNSRFKGRRVRELGLSRKYGVQVLALRRLGRQHQYQLRNLRLQSGDVLLVQGEPAALRLIHEEGDFLLVEGVDRQMTIPQKAPLALGILAAVVLLASFGVAPIVLLALAGVGAMIATRCLDVRDVVRAIDSEVILLLAGTIPLGLAISRLGLADRAAESLIATLGGGNPWLLIGAVYLLTSVTTELLSNNATAVLLTPVVLGMAAQLGVDPKPLLIAVAFGASASFSTPIGYQTNTLVLGPGGYRFADYLRIGVPLNLLLAIAATVLIPLFWPL
ncbi:MAG: SLC13 family permease [Planctomycetes bacterium]|nr:SLC13 family permease [Planctomycetota bacterium]